jgi:hypothetical protein
MGRLGVSLDVEHSKDRLVDEEQDLRGVLDLYDANGDTVAQGRMNARERVAGGDAAGEGE